MKKLIATICVLLCASVALGQGRPIVKGSTDQTTYIRIVDSVLGTPETGVIAATSGLDLEYLRVGAAAVDLTESDLGAANSAHSDGGIFHVGGGMYRVDLPDAACATGVNEVIVQGTVTDMIVIPVRHPLVNFDLYDADPPVVLADAAHGGSAAALTLKGITVAATDSNASAITITGNGSGEGMHITGGATGHGIETRSGANSGSGFYATGNNSGYGIVAIGGGAFAGISANGGPTGNGLELNGGVTDGMGALIQSQGNGIGLRVLSTGTGAAMVVDGQGAGADLDTDITGNITGNLSGSVGSVTLLATNAIVAGSFSAGAIDATAIATDAIGAAEIAADAIGASELAADAIGASEIAASAIGSSEIATAAIQAAELDVDGSEFTAQDDAIIAILGDVQTIEDFAGELTPLLLTEGIAAQSSLSSLVTTVGVAGAGLTAIDLPNQTMNITGSITGSLSGSVGSVTGAVGSVTGAVGSVTGSVGSISGVTFPTNFSLLGINGSGHISRVVLADTLTTYTGNTPQTGDSFARLGAPAGASVGADVAAVFARIGAPAGVSVSADIAAIESQTDDIGVAGAGLTAVVGGLTAQQTRDAMKLAPTAGAAASGSIDDQLADIEAGSGAELIPTDLDEEPVATSRVFTLVTTAAGLRSEHRKSLIAGSPGNTYAADFRNDAATNQRIFTVNSIAIVSGTADGLTFSAEEDWGRDKTQAKFRIVAVTAGDYVVRVRVTYNDGNTARGDLLIRVVN